MNAAAQASPQVGPATGKGQRGRWARWRNRCAFTLLLLGFVVVLLLKFMVVTIPAGSVGVLWMRFFGGTRTQFYFGEGTKLIFPWDRVYIYSRRMQRLDSTAVALSNDGVQVSMDVNTLFHVDPEFAGWLHVYVGPDYVERMITPLVASAVREQVSKIAAEDLYKVSYATIENQIEEQLQLKLRTNSSDTDPQALPVLPVLRVIDFNVTSVTLPPVIREAIAAKMSAQQTVLRYQYNIEQERLEAQRRVIEAEGIRRFQDIVTPAISDSFLRWRGIEATLALSQSQNSKIVVIGGANGLPLILDGRSDATAQAAQGKSGEKAAATDVRPGAAPQAEAASAPGGTARAGSRQPMTGQGRPGLPPEGRTGVLGLPSFDLPERTKSSNGPLNDKQAH